MTRKQVKAVLDRVLTWPRERQEDAAELLALIEEHDRSPYRLTDEQVAEVHERMADREAPTLTLSELDERLRRLGV
jgi:hypothetical protein